MALRWPLALLCLSVVDSSAQAPAGPPVPADVSPLYVVTYLELRPSAQSEGAALHLRFEIGRAHV